MIDENIATKSTFSRYLIVSLALLIILMILQTTYQLLSLIGSDESKQSEPPSLKHAVILGVNDVYRLSGIGEPQMGGLAKLRTIRKDIEMAHPEAVLLHAGDFLAPSLMSRIFQGQQMVSVMNMLDGKPYMFDERLLVTFGNHEFDHNRCDRPAPLIDRIDESQFTWLNANLDLGACDSLKSLDDRSFKVTPSKVISSGGLKLGILGIGMSRDPKNGVRYPIELERLEVIQNQVAKLKREDADVIIAVTHLEKMVDIEILDHLPELGIDIIVGGHDHSSMLEQVGDNNWLFKADSDAKSMWRLDIELDNANQPIVQHTKISLDQTVSDDSLIERAAASWKERHHKEFCWSQKPPEAFGCLNDVLGTTNTMLEGDEVENRGRETGLGDWVAQVVREKTNSDIAFINSGALRINYNIPPMTPLTRRHIEEIVEYDAKLVVEEVRGEDIMTAMQYAINQRGEGPWAHYDGVRIKLRSTDQGGGILEAYALDRSTDTWISLIDNPDAKFQVASSAYVLCSGDGHQFGIRSSNNEEICISILESANTVPDNNTKSGVAELKRSIMDSIEKAKPKGISPIIVGHICEYGGDKCYWE